MPIPKPLHSVISALHWINHNKVAGAIIDEMAEEIKKDREAERQKRAKAAEARAKNGKRQTSGRLEGPSTSKKLMNSIEGYFSDGPHEAPHPPAAPHTEGCTATKPGNEAPHTEEGDERREQRHRQHRASGKETNEREAGRSHHHYHQRRHRDVQPKRSAELTAERLALMTSGRGSPLSEPLESLQRDMTNGQVRDESFKKKRSAKDEEIGERKKQQPSEKPKFSWRKGIGAYIAERAAWKAEQRKRTQLGRAGRRRLEDPREAEPPRRLRTDMEVKGTTVRARPRLHRNNEAIAVI
ncbi:hypothetical protein W97_03983 [Coniosporium apollinis CBS 100218]|uniref:Uncharacterized protein n=1 Tax=Coniosporium apollinis (strain CBS 100218) TaxID=1168221 RepID=R7YS68_CONA1|nr:uncharacterized protein W97_03983 [Coniosporium apollinis CBS 100218]EON64750.1 hypothetical protein W97_03983 [Coniosporium apollinis CBS 100218]